MPTLAEQIVQTPGISLLLGGARSGKSRRAQELASSCQGPVSYIATAAPQGDHEMQQRIERHRRERPERFVTIEGRYDLLALAKERLGEVLLVDCLTLWLGARGLGLGSTDPDSLLWELEQCWSATRQDVRWLVVSNELGMGLVPMGEDNRVFRDYQGFANQLTARFADHVEFLVAGIPLRIK